MVPICSEFQAACPFESDNDNINSYVDKFTGEKLDTEAVSMNVNGINIGSE